jgi:hypothetical protein
LGLPTGPAQAQVNNQDQPPSQSQGQEQAEAAGALGPWLFNADGQERELPLQRLDPAALPSLPGRWQPPAPPQRLACGPVPRHRLDRSWGRSSYSLWTHGSLGQLPPQVSEEGREADLLLSDQDPIASAADPGPGSKTTEQGSP